MNTNTVPYLLHQLNSLRTAAGKPVLKAWKESRAKLEAAIAKLSDKPTDISLEEMNVKGDHFKKPEAAPAPKKTAAKKPAAKKEAADKPGDYTSLVVEYCAKNNLNPKVARAKLRRAGCEAPYSLEQCRKYLSK